MHLISSQIAHLEQKARSRHLSAIQHISDGQIPGWFNDLLEHNVLPLLVKIGFDREIAHNIFKISAPAWKSIGPTTHPKLHLHPALTTDILKIRQGIISQDEQESQNFTFPAETSLQDLTRLLQTIPATWIILPRAHSFLTISDSHYLIVYLQHLDRETNHAFEKILARILIEFIGNYSLKFINSTLPKKQMIEAIFYGYAAMFCKNILQPPQGMENLLIFKNYLSWAKAFNKRASCKDAEKEAVIAEMEEMETRILPDQNTHTRSRQKNQDTNALLITLRHGRPGINCAVQYFTRKNALLSNSSNELLANRTLPSQTNAFFRELQKNFNHETPGTRKFIHTFLMELKDVYGPRPARPNIFRQPTPDNLDFTRSRMSCMVKDFSKTLH